MGTRWSRDDETTARKMLRADATDDEIAAAIDRSPRGVEEWRRRNDLAPSSRARPRIETAHHMRLDPSDPGLPSDNRQYHADLIKRNEAFAKRLADAGARPGTYRADDDVRPVRSITPAAVTTHRNSALGDL